MRVSDRADPRLRAMPRRIVFKGYHGASGVILVEPQSGLCNRMRALDSGIELGQRVGQDVRVIWHRNEGLNCAFDALFEKPEGVDEVVEVNYGLGPVGRIARGVVRIAREGCLRATGVPTLYLRDPIPGENLSDRYIEMARQHGLSIRTCHRFMQRQQAFAQFRPSRQVSDAVAVYEERLAYSVGVHIRRTDNIEAIAHSPIEGFVSIMRKEVAKDEKTEFFVATDSMEALSTLKGVFGEAVFFHSKGSVERSEPQAIVDAAIDLYCLARCRKLIGSYWSSFSEVAWQLGGIDKVIVRAQAV